jgi:hypothetical protein
MPREMRKIARFKIINILIIANLSAWLSSVNYP